MTYIPAQMRQTVQDRARGRCEYCLFPQNFSMKPHEIDHIYAEKHGGETQADNLCLSCLDCNRHKGSDLCSFDAESANVVTLFHPRSQRWDEHFRLNGAFVEPITPIGRVTVRLLQINDEERISERSALIRLEYYP